MSNTTSNSAANSTQKLKLETAGPTATKFYPHPLDPNMGATFDGRIWTRYAPRKQTIGEWRELTSYRSWGRKTQAPNSKKPRQRIRERDLVTVPAIFARKFYPNSSSPAINAAKFNLECYLGRRLESWEVTRHGPGGPNDHSYMNLSPGDAVNNMIDDLENGNSQTSLKYLIQAQHRLARLVLNYTSTKPTDA